MVCDYILFRDFFKVDFGAWSVTTQCSVFFVVMVDFGVWFVVWDYTWFRDFFEG